MQSCLFHSLFVAEVCLSVDVSCVQIPWLSPFIGLFIPTIGVNGPSEKLIYSVLYVSVFSCLSTLEKYYNPPFSCSPCFSEIVLYFRSVFLVLCFDWNGISFFSHECLCACLCVLWSQWPLNPHDSRSWIDACTTTLSHCQGHKVNVKVIRVISCNRCDDLAECSAPNGLWPSGNDLSVLKH